MQHNATDMLINTAIVIRLYMQYKAIICSYHECYTETIVCYTNKYRREMNIRIVDDSLANESPKLNAELTHQ